MPVTIKMLLDQYTEMLRKDFLDWGIIDKNRNKKVQKHNFYFFKRTERKYAITDIFQKMALNIIALKVNNTQ